jgi:putative transposase
MHSEKGLLYHIYTQGNNGQRVFFDDDNYLFFLRKIKTHLVPFVDIMAWCLMPNHFHLMVLVNEVELIVDNISWSATNTSGSATNTSGSAAQSRAPINICSLQKSIGIILASYIRAINKQNKTTGSLFRGHKKAECLNYIDGITPSFYNTMQEH